MTSTLYGLCLSSKAMYALATPCLYSNVAVQDADALDSLLYTLQRNRNEVSRHVKALAFPRFPGAETLERIKSVSKVITLVKRSLRRLYLDRDFYRFAIASDKWKLENGAEDNRARLIHTNSLRRISLALEKIRSLESFTNARCYPLSPNIRCSGWSSWSNLTRLALFAPYVSKEMLGRLTQFNGLSHVVFANPRWRDKFIPEWQKSFHHLITKENMVKVMFITGEPIETLMGPLFRVLVAAAKVAIAAGGRDVVHVQVPGDNDDDDLDEYEGEVFAWFSHNAMDGTLWEFPGVSLSSY